MTAERSIKVKLTGEARSLVNEARESTAELRKLSATGKVTDEALKAMERQAQKSGTSLLKLAAEGKLAATELKKVENEVNDLKGSLLELGATSKLTGSGGAMAALEAETARAKARMQELADEFKRTGSASSLAGFRAAQAELKKLESLGRDVESVLSFGQSGPGLGSRLGQKLSQTIGEALGGSYGIWGYAIPGLVAAAPTVGVMLGGAILTGVGLAGIGAGIAGQLHDPVIDRAASQLGKDVSSGFRSATQDFQQPILDGLGLLASEWDRLQPGLRSTFREIAPETTEMARGAAGFVDKLVPGLERAAIASKPLVQDLARWLPSFGQNVAGLFDAMATHADEARQGLHLLLLALDMVVSDLTLITHLGSAAWDWGTPGALKQLADLENQGDQFKGAMIKNLGDVGAGAQNTAEAFQQLSSQISATTITADTLAGQMTGKILNALMSMDQADLSVAGSLINVSDALKQNKRDLDVHHAAGVADRQAVLAAVQANIQQYNALIQSGAGAEQAAAAYDQNTAALEKQLHKAGLTKQEIDGLIGKYRSVPDDVNTDIKANGLAYTLGLLQKYLEKLLGIDGTTVNTYVRTNYVKIGAGPNANKPIPQERGGVMLAAASGLTWASGGAGIYPASDPPLVRYAEPSTRGEAYIPRNIPAARGLALTDTAASWFGGRVQAGGGAASSMTVTLRVMPGADTAFGSVFNQMLRTGQIQLSVQPDGSVRGG